MSDFLGEVMSEFRALFSPRRKQSVEVRDKADRAKAHVTTQQKEADQLQTELRLLEASLAAQQTYRGREK